MRVQHGAIYLQHFRLLSTDNDLNMSGQSAELASDILIEKRSVALEELHTLCDAIGSRASSSLLASAEPASLAQLHSRTWHVHWSLFVYFNHPQGRRLLPETFLAPTYLNTIQSSCPMDPSLYRHGRHLAKPNKGCGDGGYPCMALKSQGLRAHPDGGVSASGHPPSQISEVNVC